MNYLDNYILSFFDLNKTTTVSQLFHLFNGKRTPSMFYLIETRKWHHGFLLTSELTRGRINQIVEKLKNNNKLKEIDKGYLLTEEGQENFQLYFESHYYPQKLKDFSNATIRLNFWNRFQLYTQIFSELSYNNSKYIPIIKDPSHQENVRQLFQSAHNNREKLAKQWINEQVFIFKNLANDTANALANQLTGHKIIGKTRTQISFSQEMTQMEVSFYLLDAIEELLDVIDKYKEKLPLNREILKVLKNEMNLGLSASTFQTYDLIRKNYSLQQIANYRSIKINTVKEHVLEIAFVLNDFTYNNFVPEAIYQKLHKAFSTREGYNFKQALGDFEQLEFMHFRLVELERLRS